jgi:DNA-directed RNA polymerase subunit F
MPELKIVKSQTMTLGHIASDVKPKTKKEEITPIQQKVLDHSVKFSKLNKSEELKLVEELKALEVPRMTEEHIATMVNILPKSVNELRTVFAGSKTTIAPENLEKIQNTLSKYEK